MADRFGEMLAAMLRSLAGVVPPERLLAEYARRIEEKHEEVAAIAQELGGREGHDARLWLMRQAKKRHPELSGLELLREERGHAVLALGRRTFALEETTAPSAETAAPQAVQQAPAQAADDDVAARARFLELD